MRLRRPPDWLIIGVALAGWVQATFYGDRTEAIVWLVQITVCIAWADLRRSR